MALRGAVRDRRKGRGRALIDGNETRRLTSWLVPFPGSVWEPLDEEQLDKLMEWTVEGHLSWCVFPIDNIGGE